MGQCATTHYEEPIKRHHPQNTVSPEITTSGNNNCIVTKVADITSYGSSINITNADSMKQLNEYKGSNYNLDENEINNRKDSIDFYEKKIEKLQALEVSLI